MTRKWRLLAWLIYTVVSFLVLLIGFHWRVALPISIIIGFVCGLFNELIQLLTTINDKLDKEEEDLEDET